MRNANSNFGSGLGGSIAGVYKCTCCGKRTRETGSCESGCELCVDCYDYAGWENTHSDDAHNDDPKRGKEEGCPICAGEVRGGDNERSWAVTDEGAAKIAALNDNGAAIRARQTEATEKDLVVLNKLRRIALREGRTESRHSYEKQIADLWAHQDKIDAIGTAIGTDDDGLPVFPGDANGDADLRGPEGLFTAGDM